MGPLDTFSTLELLSELKRRYSCLTKPEKRLVFVGAPGSGKGTQSSTLEREYCLCHISTGDMLREAVKEQTKYGRMAKSRMDAGQLVDDEIVLPLLEEKLASPECRRGFILDGFPRNINQADSLQTMLARHGQELDGVVYFDIDEEELKRRVCGRRVHVPSGRLYHTQFKPPRTPGIDDVTGESLVHRKDDNEETLRHRMKSFRSETMPLIDYYSRLGVLHRLDAKKPSNGVKADLFAVVEGSGKGESTTTSSSSSSATTGSTGAMRT
eukprot:GHVS01084917.1.p1 GENE.GHVS01084917.1~~GHVS01084917.1.p1  ORF type:complete len:268 (+),score=40.42 GHVS01084917.1:484-1287(+)